MAKTRAKKTVYTGVKQEEMETAFADYARADARIQKINATMDIEMTKIREKYQDELTKLGEVKEKSFDILQAYALENRDELFSKRKSLETTHGTIGFRTGTPKLKTLKGFTWASVLTLVKKFLPDYVRTSEEVNKEKLLTDRDTEIPSDDAETAEQVCKLKEKMKDCGITVVQDETFYVEPKKEE